MSKVLSRLLMAGLVLAAFLSLAGCASKAAEPAPAPEQSAPAATESQAPESPGKTDDVTELKTEDLVVGTGVEAKAGNAVTVNYTGWFTDGTEFDSSWGSGQPFTFNLGKSEVIQGWDVGVEGMKVGGRRMLSIPPAMGYGAPGTSDGSIPPNATLVFVVELLAVN